MPDSPNNPFPGLRPFRTDEEYLFFGRDTQCQDLLRLLSKRRFLAVLGSSGTGKSSLVRAGLLPALYRGGLVKAGSHWSVAILRPGGAPMWNLARALQKSELWDHLAEDIPVPESLEIETVLQRSGMGLREVAQMAQMPEEENLIIVVDQFEELFRFHNRTSTMEERDAAEAFVNLLLEGARDPKYSIHVVLTMRSGFFGECTAFAGLSEVINRGAYLIPRLTRDQLKEAIEGPVKVSGTTITPRLIQRVLNDAGGSPDELPVLQHALMRTWNRWHERDVPHEEMDLYHYEEIGEMKEALSRHADEVYQSLSKDDQLVAERLFKALTEKNTDNRGIRRPMSLERLTGIIAKPEESVARVIDAFRAPGVSFLMPASYHSLRPDSIIDISHESLMRVWKRLGHWVEEETQSARIYQRLTETAALWEDKKADLYHDPDLHIARSWQQETHPNALWAEQYGGGFTRAMHFLNESNREKEESERAAELSQQRELASAKDLADERARSVSRSRRFSLILAAFSVLLAFLTAAAYFAMRFAREQAHIARDAQLAAEKAQQAVSQTFSQSDYQFGQAAAEAGRYAESLAYLTRALKNERSLTAAGDRIHAILTEVSLPVPHFFHHDSRDVEIIAFTPDSSTLVTGSNDNYVRIWDIDSNKELSKWKHQDRVQAIAISHDGQKIATGSRDGDVLIFDRSSSRLIGNPLEHRDDVNALAFSNDDTMLLTCSDEDSLHLWDWAQGAERRRFFHESEVNDASFSPDQRSIVSVSDDNTARLWDIATGQEMLRISHNHDVTNVEFHPNGSQFLTASEDSTAKLWDTETGECLATLTHEDIVRAAHFSPDGTSIATCSQDRTVRLWSTLTGQEIHRWSHREEVDMIDFSPDGKLIASASDDQTVRIWETVSGWESSVSPLIHRMDVDIAKFSPDGNWLGTVADSEVRVWRFEDFREPPLVFPLEDVTAGRLSPSGQWAAAGSANGIVGQWQTKDAQVRHPETHHRTAISQVAYSPNGKWLVSGDMEGTVKVWEAQTGKPFGDELVHQNPITAILIPQDELLLVVHDRRIQSWSIPNGQRGPEIEIPSPVTVAAASKIGNFVALGTQKGATLVYDATTLSLIREFTQTAAINSLDFSGHLLASASDDWSAHIWDLRTGQELSRPMGHGGEVTSIRFSPKGNMLITGAHDQRAMLWSTDNASVLGRALTHRNGVVAADFSPDGQLVVTASADLMARVWDAATTLPLTQPLTHETPIIHVAFTPDGRDLFTVAHGDRARLWNVSLGSRGQLAPDIFLDVAQAIGGLRLSGNNQLVPLDPDQRRFILRKAEMETRRLDPANDNAYLRFIREFIEKHGPDLRPKKRAFPDGKRPPRGNGRGFGGRPPQRAEQQP
ncbi:MAG: WD40 repeat protein [Verrucomicrobiales bacterium]|jgi:WD40 repeat protein